MSKQEHDEVNHPKHYTSDPSGVECITIVEHRNFNVGNVIKYCWRAGLKDADEKKHIQDLRKAQWYLNREIQRLGGAETEEERFKREANDLAKQAIDRMRKMSGVDFSEKFATSRREDIEKAIENLLMQGIDLTDPPEVVFAPGTVAVTPGGIRVTVENTYKNLDGELFASVTDDSGVQARIPIEELALPSDPVPVRPSEAAHS